MRALGVFMIIIDVPPWLADFLVQLISGMIGVFVGYLLAVYWDTRKRRLDDQETARALLSVVRSDLELMVGLSDDIHRKFQLDLTTPTFYTVSAQFWHAIAGRLPPVIEPNLVRRISEVYHGFDVLGRRLDASVAFYSNVVLLTERDEELRGELLKRFASLNEQIRTQIERTEEGKDVGLVVEARAVLQSLQHLLP